MFVGVFPDVVPGSAATGDTSWVATAVALPFLGEEPFVNRPVEFRAEVLAGLAGLAGVFLGLRVVFDFPLCWDAGSTAWLDVG